MRSRTARLAASAVASIAIVAAAFLTFQFEKHITASRSAGRVFDVRAREASDAFADLRVAEEAYVAEGQGAPFWMTKVSTISAAAADALTSLLQLAGTAPARTSLNEAAAALVEFGRVDARARDYIKSGQELMAGDVIFTEGVETAAAAGRHVEAARVAEQQAFDAAEAGTRRQQALALSGAAAIVTFVVLLLGIGKPGESSVARSRGLDLASPVIAANMEPVERKPKPVVPVRSSALKNAAQLCTEFGRVRDLNDLQMLAGRTAALMEASGLIVWLGSTSGADLRPVVAHGYPLQALARMASVPRSDDNAAAAAYRTGELRIVLARPWSPRGAVVAPILSVDGCVGALSAEFLTGAETSETVHSLAVIFASHLAGVLAPPSAADAADAAANRLAANS